jgi:DNA-binding transcriptional MerR regulator
VNPEGLTAGAVARRLGVAVTTLRTWHQRYGLGPTGHQPGRHRRYTESDLARLEVMRRLTAAGLPPAEAARRAVTATTDTPDPMSVSGRDGGGWAIPVGRAGPVARGLARAALRLDAATVRRILDEAVRGLGVVDAWDQVVRPVLVGVGTRHAATGRLVEVEHLLSGCVSAALAAVPRADAPATILLACADEEQHTLALEAVFAALAERGVAARMLGARVPTAALLDAIVRTGPDALLLWSQTRATGDTKVLHEVLDLRRPPTSLLVGGPGWGEPPPPPVIAVPTLPAAVAVLTSVPR